MDQKTKSRIITLYLSGYSLKKIANMHGINYGRETIRTELKKEGIKLRDWEPNYKAQIEFSEQEKQVFAELLGYLYGDGSLSKRTYCNSYNCSLAFAHNEYDLVKRVNDITNQLFQFKPSVFKDKSNYMIRFKGNFAKYLFKIGYPCGKKSAINPNFPINILDNEDIKIHFIRGFLNAEATINKTISVQQSVRIELSKEEINQIYKLSKIYLMKNIKCHFLRWSKAKTIINPNRVKQSNMLQDLNRLLESIGVYSKIYPIRVYVGINSGIHYELVISYMSLKKAKALKLLSSNKKIDKLSKCRGS